MRKQTRNHVNNVTGKRRRFSVIYRQIEELYLPVTAEYQQIFQLLSLLHCYTRPCTCIAYSLPVTAQSAVMAPLLLNYVQCPFHDLRNYLSIYICYHCI
jgi:hypothetical protein